jgi:CheY-like chemotaxis protein
VAYFQSSVGRADIFHKHLVSEFHPDILESMLLLVEDEAPARYAFARILRNHGHEVMEAADGQEALTLLEQHNFDLVITDVAMPKVTGFALAAQMRVKWPDIPILLLTAYLSPDASRALLRGNVEFLPKPVDHNELIARVERLAIRP